LGRLPIGKTGVVSGDYIGKNSPDAIAIFGNRMARPVNRMLRINGTGLAPAGLFKISLPLRRGFSDIVQQSCKFRPFRGIEFLRKGGSAARDIAGMLIQRLPFRLGFVLQAASKIIVDIPPLRYSL